MLLSKLPKQYKAKKLNYIAKWTFEFAVMRHLMKCSAKPVARGVPNKANLAISRTSDTDIFFRTSKNEV